MVLALSACKGRETSGPTPAPSSSPTPKASPVEKIEATPEAVKKAEAALQNAAERGRRGRACLGFEDFRSTVYREPFDGGKYIVNGDTPILNEKQLREFFEQRVKPPQLTALILAQVSGMDAKWNQQQKRKLTYCVSRTFDQRYDKVVQDMESATGEWKRWAAIEFVHDPSQDANCGPSNEAVVFDVRPVNVNEEYLARAFFPNEPRAARNVLIDESTFALPPAGNLQLAGVLRHELGHTLGFRHEHTRPDSGACFEDRDWRPLTDYDAFSVMHYPQCNGRGDWRLNLTDKDKNGAACVYGVAPGFTIDTSLVVDVSECATDQPGTPSPNQPQTESFNAQSVAKGAQKQYGPLAVTAGSLFEVSMGGSGATGDPDLYVRFGAKPSLTAYDCRPFLVGPIEVCSLNVPANARQAFVMVNGYTAGTYDLQVTRVPPATALRRPASGTPK
jgi:hypothetical protein